MPKSKSAQPPRRMTMADLAALAGVSKITVSRALRDSHAVKPEVKARIKTLARQHGYRLNVSALYLRRQRRHMIAVVIEMSPSDERPMSEPYPLVLLGGIAQALAAANYSMLVTMRAQMTADQIEDSIGVILLGQGVRDHSAHMLEQFDVPLVVWGALSSSHSYITVGSDNRMGGRQAGERLISLGRRKLVFLGDSDHAETADRLLGFRERVMAAGGELVAEAGCDFTTAAGYEATLGLLRQGIAFDGVFACNDLAAVGAMQALREMGRAVPDDVAMVGFDDSPAASMHRPSVTTIQQDWASGGRLLAAKILAKIHDEPVQSEALPTRLVIRET